MSRVKDRNIKPTFRRYQLGDFDMIDLHPCYEGDVGCKERCEQLALSNTGHVFTILNDDGDPMAVIGLTWMYSRVAEVWAIVDKDVENNPHYYAMRVKFLADMLWFDLCPWMKRAQLHIKASTPWGGRWAKFLGFAKEGVMHNYGEENEDYILYSKVR